MSPSSGSATSWASRSCPGARSAASRTPSDLGASFRPFAEVAQEVDATPQQVTLAWMLAKSPVVIPIPGSSRPETIRASAAAVDLQLTEAQVARLDQP